MLLRPRPPFRLDLTVWALRRQPHNRIDRWEAGAWRRVLAPGDAVVGLEVRQRGADDAPLLEVRLHGPHAGEPGVQAAALAAVRRILGLDEDLSGFYRAAAADSRLAPLAARYRGMRPQRFADLFEALANAVACQQVSLNSGIALLGRLCDSCGRRLPGEDAAVAFPRPQDLRGVDVQALRAQGWSRQKASYLLDIAAALADGAFERALERSSDEQALHALLQLRGVGRWSAQYALLRGLGRLRAFPVDDVGARKYLGLWLGLPSAPDARATADVVERWQPWAGLIYFHLLLWRLEQAGALRVAAAQERAAADNLEEIGS